MPHRLLASHFPELGRFYLSIEFFLNLTPCYFFIMFGICRYISLFRAQSPSSPGDSGEDESASIHFPEPIPAFHIKVKLSYFMAFLYFLSTGLAFLLPESLLWAAGCGFWSLCYLAGGLSWVLSAKLIVLEFEKDYSQELYTHQLFCPLTFAISLLNIFLKENPLIDLIFHVLKTILAFVLTVYVWGKPNDRVDSSSENENMTTSDLKQEKNRWLIAILDKFESLPLIQKIFRYVRPKYQESIPLLEILSSKHSISDSNHGSKARSFQSNNKLLKNIPENRLIVVELSPENEESREEILNPVYVMLTKINEKSFTARRNFEEILDLYNFLLGIYKTNFSEYMENFPEFHGCSNPIDIEILLNGLISEPAFIHPRLLDLLRVSHPQERKPFMEYFNSIVPKKSLKLIGYPESLVITSPYLRRNSENNAEFKESGESVMPISLFHLNSHKLVSFEVSCSGWEKAKDENHYKFIFHLKCLPAQVTWTIKKSLSDVKEFDKILQETLKKNFNFFKHYVPKKTANFRDMDDAFLEERRKGLEKYMKEVLNDKSFFDEVLFSFLEFDIEKRLPTKQDLNYSLTDDEVPPEGVLVESSSPILFHSLKEDNFILPEDKPKFGYVKTNELFSPSYRPRRKVVNDINFNNVRIVFKGVKSVQIHANAGGRASKRSYTVSTKMERNYLINFEEVETVNSPRVENIRTMIKLSKNYKEIEEFDRIIRKNFENEYLPDLPEDEEDIPESKRKRFWDEYFGYLVSIRMIEENQTFKDFFHLDRARNRYMNDPERKETNLLDFT